MLSTPKRKAIFIILAAVILAAAVFLGWILAGNSTPTEEGTPSYSTDAVDWNEELEGDEPETGYITMPGYDTIPSRQEIRRQKSHSPIRNQIPAIFSFSSYCRIQRRFSTLPISWLLERQS